MVDEIELELEETIRLTFHYADILEQKTEYHRKYAQYLQEVLQSYRRLRDKKGDTRD